MLSRRFEQHYTGDDFKLYRALRSINPSPYLFYFDFGGFRIFGSSPETHCRIDGRHAYIDPIAGTIDANTDGFIYMVSSAATTGAQKSFDGRKLEYFKRIDSLGLRNPRMTGFGISNRDTFRTACEWSSGAIVGSRFVTLLDEHEGNAEEAVLALKHDLGLS